ncbi:AAA family ATPase [Pseudomonas sp.]|uniref:AAA family ATPase n=1 Tax=Pseudomonas sp. TaxID=306 RepID=UPI0028AEB786|nr:AAA family ATPase [Pseudomonas sp.]
MYAKSLHIYDFKCYGKAVLDLQYPSRVGKHVSEMKNVNLILGDNGGGKSSILRALTIAALAPALLESGFVPYRLVRRAKPDAPAAEQCLLKIEAIGTLNESFELSGNRKKPVLLARLETRGRGSLDRLHLESTPDSPVAKLLADDYSPAFFVAGYGATRRVESGEYSESSARRSRGLRYGRIAGLFEDQMTLRPLQLWLPRLRRRNPQQHASVVELLNRVLPPDVRFTGERDEEDEQYMFLSDIPTPFSALSDGYKAFIGWVSDLIGHLCDVAPAELNIDEVPGMVLVDEIDLHLHPQWQRSVVPTLAGAFPHLQFFFTSHSPLVASTVKRENVFITDTATDGTATIKQLEEHVFGRSMEQLLLSAYFGLQSTRPDAFQAEDEALFRQAANGDADAALDFLARLTHAAPLTAPSASKEQGKRKE